MLKAPPKPPTSPETPQEQLTPNRPKTLRKPAKVLSVVVGVILAITLVNYVVSQVQLAPLVSEAERMNTDVMVPAGAVQVEESQMAYGINILSKCLFLG